MRLPNKLFSYSESIVSKFPIILNVLEERKHLTIYELYTSVIGKFNSITEFLEALECLYALDKIGYDYKLRRLHNVI